MSGCPHEYHEREASVYVDGLCPLCQRAEIERLQERLKGSDMLAHVRGEQIERLQEWRVMHPYSEVDMDMHVEAVTKELRADNERLRAQLVSDINAETEIDRLETEIERLKAALRMVLENQAAGEIERLRKALTTIVEVLPESSTAAAIARRALEGK